MESKTGNGSNSNTTEEHTILARAAFGRESCVKLERNGRGTWLRVGKKSGEAWDWKKAKLSDVEIAEMLLVLELRQEQAGFFHKFNGNETRISVGRKEQTLFIRVDDYAAALNLSRTEPENGSFPKSCVCRREGAQTPPPHPFRFSQILLTHGMPNPVDIRQAAAGWRASLS